MKLRESYMSLLGVVNHHVSIKSFTNIQRQKDIKYII